MADTPYGILLASFFDGTTGMRLQGLGTPGKDALLLAAFLTCNEWANMIGLYELSPAKLARKLPAIKGKALTKAFDLLAAERYAHYDTLSEYVWVREMARIRLGIVAGEKVGNPRKLVAAQNCYQRANLNPFLGPFYDRYHLELALKHRRHHAAGGGSGNVRQTFTDKFGETSGNVRQTFGERASGTSTSGTSTTGSWNSDQVPVKAAAAPRLSPDDTKPDENVEVITAIVTKDILPLGVPEDELIEATKARCAILRVKYDGQAVRKAVESAVVRARLAKGA